MDARIDDQADGAPDVTFQAAVIAVRILVEANILAQLLGVETPPFGVSRVPEIFAKLGNAGEFLSNGYLQMVPGQTFVVSPALSVRQGSSLKLISIDKDHAGPGTIWRAVLVIGRR